MKRLFPSFLVFLFIVLTSMNSYAQNQTVSIQGTLKNASGEAVSDATYEVDFALYNVSTGGTALWTETAMVEVAGGVYNHKLGSENPLTSAVFQNTAYLGVTVGNTELLPRAEITYAPYTLAAASVVCSGAIGDIKYSILKPTQFAAVNGDCWVEMDGGTHANSALASILSIDTVPDMSGLFIRAQEYNEGNDPDRTTTSPVASIQGDQIKAHDHTFSGTTSEDGNHTHPYGDSYLNSFSQNGTASSSTNTSIPRNGWSSYVSQYYGSDRMDFHNTLSSQNTSASGNHTHTVSGSTSSVGGTETRPTNMNFYIYIRIN